MAVAPWIVSDELWERFEPLLPKKERRFRYPGRISPLGRVAEGGRLGATARATSERAARRR
jgi:hypothetical protein